MQRGIATHGRVAMATIAADTRDLDRALIEFDIVGLLGVGRGVRSGNRNVDRRVDRNAEVDEAAGEMAVAT